MLDHEFIRGEKPTVLYIQQKFPPQVVHVIIDFLAGANGDFINSIYFFDLAKCFDTIGNKILLL